MTVTGKRPQPFRIIDQTVHLDQRGTSVHGLSSLFPPNWLGLDPDQSRVHRPPDWLPWAPTVAAILGTGRAGGVPVPPSIDSDEDLEEFRARIEPAEQTTSRRWPFTERLGQVLPGPVAAEPAA